MEKRTMQRLGRVVTAPPILMSLTLLCAQIVTANEIIITIGGGPNEVAGSTGSFVGGIAGGATGNISATGGTTTAGQVASALAAATGGVASGNTVTYNGATGGGAIMDGGLFSGLSVQKIVEPIPPPQPPPPIAPPLPQPPPNGAFTSFFDVFTDLSIGGSFNEDIQLGNFQPDITVPFTPGEPGTQLNNDLFNALTPYQSQLPAGVTLTQVNGEPTFSGASFYSFSDQVTITLNSPGNPGFEVGAVIASPGAEPGSILCAGLGLLLVGFLGWRGRRLRST
jgi:hypothetical protein